MNSQNIENYSMNELRAFCRDNNIKSYSRFTKKGELINFIKEQQNSNYISYNDDLSYNDTLTTQMLNNEYEENFKLAIEASKNQEKKKIEKSKIERENQDSEYLEALQQDLLHDNSTETLDKEEDKLDYQKNITDNELDKIRLSRIMRFS